MTPDPEKSLKYFEKKSELWFNKQWLHRVRFEWNETIGK
jgi:hypothetical protein